jgi:hypothetical protein
VTITWKRTAPVLIALLSVSVGLAAQDAVARLVDEALLALPERLRGGAAVVRFEDGEQLTLREGTNGVFCRADDPDVRGIAVWCYPESHDAYARRWYQLAAEGQAPGEVDAMIAKEIESGTLEWPDVAVNYNLRGPSLDNALLNTVVFVPFATGESLGIAEERSFSRPWLMNAGTAFAHIMIPGQ